MKMVDARRGPDRVRESDASLLNATILQVTLIGHGWLLVNNNVKHVIRR